MGRLVKRHPYIGDQPTTTQKMDGHYMDTRQNEKRRLRFSFCGELRKRLLQSHLYGAEGGTRTHTTLRPLDFESSASTSSTTSALEIQWVNNIPKARLGVKVF